MSAPFIADLEVGDIIETRRLLKVTSNHLAGVALADTATGQGFFINPGMDHGTLSITRVKKAAKPKPKVGDVLTVDEVRAVNWRRGTVLEAAGYAFVLTGDGEWFSPGREDRSAWLTDGFTSDVQRTFQELDIDLDNDDKFTVVRLP